MRLVDENDEQEGSLKAWETFHRTFINTLENSSALVQEIASKRAEWEQATRERGGSTTSTEISFGSDLLPSAFAHEGGGAMGLGAESSVRGADNFGGIFKRDRSNKHAHGHHGIAGVGEELQNRWSGDMAAATAASNDTMGKMLRVSFTECHNSRWPSAPNDSSSVFLGDELSVHAAGAFSALNRAMKSKKRPSSDTDPRAQSSSPDPPLPPATPVFLPLVDCGTWSGNGPEWVVPSVIAGFPQQPLQRSLKEWPHCPLTHTSTQEPIDWFTSYQLGRAGVLCSGAAPPALDISATSTSTSATASPESTPYHHSIPHGSSGSLSSELHGAGKLSSHTLPPAVTRWLLLRQNTLFEFPSADTAVLPIGFLNLGRATISRDLLDPMVVRISALAEPSLDARKVEALIKAPTLAAATRWIEVLQEASSLSVASLYEFVPNAPQRPGSPLPSHAASADTDKEPAELGRGRFSTVMRARRRYHTEGRQAHLCALKVVNKATFHQRVEEGKERQDTLVREALAQAVLTAKCAENPYQPCYIVRMYSLFETVEELVLEMELMSGVDLFDKLSSKGVMNDAEAAALVCNVLKATQFCSQQGYAHRDIKLSNLIYPADASYKTDPSNVKLADFGMAGKVGEDGLLYGRCGTPGYVAPEILHANVSEGYPMNVDAFSVGVVAYTVLCGYEPLYGVNERQLIAANKAAKFEFHMPEWQFVPEDAKDLVTKLMERDPAVRITPAQALEHPWIRRHCSSSSRLPPSMALQTERADRAGGECVAV